MTMVVFGLGFAKDLTDFQTPNRAANDSISAVQILQSHGNRLIPTTRAGADEINGLCIGLCHGALVSSWVG